MKIVEKIVVSNSNHIGTTAEAAEKPGFMEPRLEFVEPKLASGGKITEVTAGFGSFSP